MLFCLWVHTKHFVTSNYRSDSIQTSLVNCNSWEKRSLYPDSCACEGGAFDSAS